jgi:hypothetical protein
MFSHQAAGTIDTQSQSRERRTIQLILRDQYRIDGGDGLLVSAIEGVALRNVPLGE